ncbi:LysR substrate-binding domain-containing protein [Cupriavidus neocaledonicus]|uniref:Transcriptional Regulator, LysR family n=1 Tax=Cupriavidus neocaledonicus TaxID=1040979 RepID=A0A375HQ99_9BURK|nr:LysR substrate-binding domain-containing protein [Cupriavidus neocaledonicus]SOZ40251.1 putative Transcriptional Regulator, LysR family [Cupriavidus neocaledonicus]SPD60408.1 putative Transcriptional Regulator, LysR family [Cupriavidus neocaledonicus]
MFHQYYKSIRCFHAVARTGGFTAAAQYLHIGQPTVTDQVKALETRFGVELFLRSGRGVRLTDTGERLYAITQGLFGQEEEAMQFLHSAHKLKTGLVRVGAVSPPIALGLARSFRSAHAALELTVTIGSEASVLRGLQDFDIDVGIVAEPDPVAGLHIAPYRRERIVAVMPAGHALAARASVTLQDLAGEAVIQREPGSKTRDRVERACAQQGVALHCVMEINSREAILHAVASGMGLSFVTQIECIPLPGLQVVPVDEPLLSIDYSLCCLAVRKERPLISALFAVALGGG